MELKSGKHQTNIYSDYSAIKLEIRKQKKS